MYLYLRTSGTLVFKQSLCAGASSRLASTVELFLWPTLCKMTKHRKSARNNLLRICVDLYQRFRYEIYLNWKLFEDGHVLLMTEDQIQEWDTGKNRWNMARAVCV